MQTNSLYVTFLNGPVFISSHIVKWFQELLTYSFIWFQVLLTNSFIWFQ